MKQRIAAFLMCVICLLSVVGCGQTKADTNTPSAANQQTVTDDYLTTISGMYVELFPELSKADYRSIWHDATAPLMGEDNADAATDKLLGMCTAKIYGADAAEKYAADPDSMAFDCYFLGGVSKFVMDGHKITGLDTQGKKVFSHTYRKLDKEMKTASFSIRARTKTPANSPTLPSLRTRWRPPITWSSAMRRISMTCRAGSRAIMLTGTHLRSPRITIRRR